MPLLDIAVLPPSALVQAGSRREWIRDRSGKLVGTYDYDERRREIVARDAAGRIVGRYSVRTGETRDARGRLVARGANMLPALLLRP